MLKWKTWAKLAFALSLCWGGMACQRARVIDSKSDDALVTSGEINIQDWSSAAEHMIDSLLASGIFPAGQRKVIMVSKVLNQTHRQVDTALLTKKIRVALNKSGRVLTSTELQGEDPAPRVVRDLRSDDEFNAQTLPSKGELVAPDYSLSGKILQVNASAGRTQQASYVFQLSMTNLRTGLAEWEDEVDITKQSTKSLIGW